MFGIDSSISQAAQIIAAPIWVFDFLLACIVGMLAWWWIKGRQ